jgi:hypothetical protein
MAVPTTTTGRRVALHSLCVSGVAWPATWAVSSSLHCWSLPFLLSWLLSRFPGGLSSEESSPDLTKHCHGRHLVSSFFLICGVIWCDLSVRTHLITGSACPSCAPTAWELYIFDFVSNLTAFSPTLVTLGSACGTHGMSSRCQSRERVG